MFTRQLFVLILICFNFQYAQNLGLKQENIYEIQNPEQLFEVSRDYNRKHYFKISLEAINRALELKKDTRYLMQKAIILLKKDRNKAIAIVKTCIEDLQNNTDGFSYYALGLIFEEGIGVDKNILKAIQFYKKSARKFDTDAMVELGILYEHNVISSLTGESYNLKKDLEKAFQWYTKAANLNNTKAMFHLVQLYNNIDFEKKDEKKSFMWSKKAANLGDVLGMLAMGGHYNHGIGVEKNFSLGMKWYLKASPYNASAKNYIGSMYFNGLGVKKNYREALKWYSKALEEENLFFIGTVADMYYQGLGTKIDYKKAFELYLKAAENDVKWAFKKLGDMYKNGIGIEKNLEKAEYWYNKYEK